MDGAAEAALGEGVVLLEVEGEVGRGVRTYPLQDTACALNGPLAASTICSAIISTTGAKLQQVDSVIAVVDSATAEAEVEEEAVVLPEEETEDEAVERLVEEEEVEVASEQKEAQRQS